MRDLLEEVVSHWGLDLEVSSSVREDTVEVELTGADARLLAEDDGAVLQALQYLCSKMVSRILSDNVRVLLDADGVRARRDAGLRERALAVAAEVRETGRKARLEPLPPYERRIVHLVLLEDPEVRTYSLGGGYLKRITISLASEASEGSGAAGGRDAVGPGVGARAFSESDARTGSGRPKAAEVADAEAHGTRDESGEEDEREEGLGFHEDLDGDDDEDLDGDDDGDLDGDLDDDDTEDLDGDDGEDLDEDDGEDLDEDDDEDRDRDDESPAGRDDGRP